MNLRILLAFIITLTIHGILFFTNFKFLRQDAAIFPTTNVIQMNLASTKKESAESHIKKRDTNSKELKNKNALIQPHSDTDNNDPKNSDERESITVIHKAMPLNFSNKAPEYPRVARLRGYQGMVILNVLVNRNGTVSEIKINQSSGYWLLDKAALIAVKYWKFEPGANETGPVEMWVEQPIRFQLK